ncbi:hypothetical protein [Epilithonimonas sp.]|nr:hypothetical protein [Epilithonimonas sp.]
MKKRGTKLNLQTEVLTKPITTNKIAHASVSINCLFCGNDETVRFLFTE